MPSILKVNQIQKTSSTSNIINKSGSTITLGASGTTVSLACGATSTGFAASSFVDWCTTAKTAPFTGANGTGYFVNTSCGAITVTLPATPTAGDIVSLKDYGGTWATNSVTLCGNSSKINGVCATATLNTNSQSVTLIYVDATKGWQDIQDSSAAVTGNPYLVATGGTVTTCGDYKIHTFTSDSTFTVCSTGSPTYAYVDYLVIAGGGAGGDLRGGGGGAGGFRESYNPCISGTYSASPLATPTSLPVTATAYPITIGSGGNSNPSTPYIGGSGSSSIFSSITSAGGGGGGGYGSGNSTGVSGGSGGGGGAANGSCTATSGGTGNTPPVSPPQGNNGGGNPNLDYGAGGGGGASAVGGNAPGTSTPGQVAGVGGAGVSSSITGSSVTRAGGGGGGGYTQWNSGGTGGGGDGGTQVPAKASTAGTVNTGGGGGGRGCSTAGGSPAGGSGIVILRYRYQ